ncbi:MAG: hypothetical protein E1N59_1713 [Puniceicoccaceae bacterium 5H]|nr:MAG: hypothetical protein E1N59_1713 [Puniceicoccaceae bacterium 5H]
MKKTLASLALLGLAASAAHAYALWGVNDANELVKFESTNPGTVYSSTAITGLNDAFSSIVDFDYNPNDGYFYGVDNNAYIYRFNTKGQATLLSDTFLPSGYDADMAYDPFYSNFRWVSDMAENVALETDGSTSYATDFFYGSGDANEGAAPYLSGIGIDPDFGELFVIDPELDILAQSFDPDGGELFTIGSLGLDITGYSSLMVDGNGNLLASLSVDGLTSGLYSIDLMDGSATLVGDFGQGINAIAVPEPRTYAALAGVLALAVAAFRRRRA